MAALVYRVILSWFSLTSMILNVVFRNIVWFGEGEHCGIESVSVIRCHGSVVLRFNVGMSMFLCLCVYEFFIFSRMVRAYVSTFVYVCVRIEFVRVFYVRVCVCVYLFACACVYVKCLSVGVL